LPSLWCVCAHLHWHSFHFSAAEYSRVSCTEYPAITGLTFVAMCLCQLSVISWGGDLWCVVQQLFFNKKMKFKTCLQLSCLFTPLNFLSSCSGVQMNSAHSENWRITNS
jgi:hypothetical protein